MTQQTLLPIVGVISADCGTPQTMSSREIAELVEARHNDVVATIERLFSKGLLRSSRKSRREATGGRPIDVYDLIERDTHLVVAGYSDEHRAKVIDRWQELEAAQLAHRPTSLDARLPVIAPELIAFVNGGVMTKRSAIKRFDAWLLAREPAFAVAMRSMDARRNAVTPTVPTPAQLELAPPPSEPVKPARKPRATPAPKPTAPPPVLGLTSPTATMNVGELDNFVFHEVAGYVAGGERALRAALLARDLINEFDAPTKKAAGLFVRRRTRIHWYVRKVLRACGVPLK